MPFNAIVFSSDAHKTAEQNKLGNVLLPLYVYAAVVKCHELLYGKTVEREGYGW